MQRLSIYLQFLVSYLPVPFWLAAVLLVSSCGATGPFKRDYEFAIASPTQAARAEIRSCFQFINQMSGIEMLHVAAERADDQGLTDKQSQVVIIPGRTYKDPGTNAPRIAQAKFFLHQDETTTILAQFDYSAFTSRISRMGERVSPYNLRTCAHEIAHGVGITDHTASQFDIMHASVTEQYNDQTWPSFIRTLRDAYKEESPADYPY